MPKHPHKPVPNHAQQPADQEPAFFARQPAAAAGFADLRPEAAIQRMRQEGANQSGPVQRQRAYQLMAGGRAEAAQPFFTPAIRQPVQHALEALSGASASAAAGPAADGTVQRVCNVDVLTPFSKLPVMDYQSQKQAEIIWIITTFETAEQQQDLLAQYRQADRVRSALEQALELLVRPDNFILKPQDHTEQIAQTQQALRSALSALDSRRKELENQRDIAAADDKKTGKLIYRDPPLDVAAGRRVLEALSQGQDPAKAVPGITVPPSISTAKTAQTEWGLGQNRATGETVIIPGGPTSTPFPDYPYLTPLAHSHPEKTGNFYQEQSYPEGWDKLTPYEQRKKRGLVSLKPSDQQASMPLGQLLDGQTKIGFQMDLLPSREDIVISASRPAAQRVYTAFSYDQANQLILNSVMHSKGKEFPQVVFGYEGAVPDPEANGEYRFKLQLIVQDQVVKEWNPAFTQGKELVSARRKPDQKSDSSDH
jgi:hypothetical protein